MRVHRVKRVILFLLLALACARSANAAPENPNIPNAPTAAKRFGQFVEFKDDVKAVSYSRTSTGYYMSFGAPWPKQALSVWAPAKMYDKLPFAHSMVGRTVIINGKIEPTPDGPLIKLES